MKVAVVIPNWNGLDMLAPCLDSLRSQTRACDVIVVDNGSTDGSIELLAEKYAWVRVVKCSRNYGFAGGVNRGIRPALEAGADFVALFNNDAVADKDWLHHLVAAAEAHPEAGLVTGKFMRIDRKHLDTTGDFLSIWGLPWPRGRNEVDTGQYDAQTDVFGASGGATLYRATMLQDIGLFDEDFFAYYEDVDLSFRAQLAGWRTFYEHQAVAYHHLSATSSKHGDLARFHSAKNFILLYAKNMPLKLYLKYCPLFVLQFLRMAASSTLRGKPGPFLRGTWAAVRLHSGTVRKRKQIQAARKVPVGYIDGILYHHRPPKPPRITEVGT